MHDLLERARLCLKEQTQVGIAFMKSPYYCNGCNSKAACSMAGKKYPDDWYPKIAEFCKGMDVDIPDDLDPTALIIDKERFALTPFRS